MSAWQVGSTRIEVVHSLQDSLVLDSSPEMARKFEIGRREGRSDSVPGRSICGRMMEPGAPNDLVVTTRDSVAAYVLRIRRAPRPGLVAGPWSWWTLITR